MSIIGVNPLTANMNNSLIANSLMMPDRERRVFRLTQFNVISLIMERIGGASRKVEGYQGAYDTPLLALSTVKAVIATSTQSGNNVILTFTDPTYEDFRVQDIVVANVAANVRGLVLSEAAGTVTIGPPSGSGVLPATSFAAGQWLQTQGNAWPTNSNSPRSLYEVPILSTNYVQKFRDKLELQRDDFSNGTWVDFNGKPCWALAQEPLFLERVYRQLEWQHMFGAPALNTATGLATEMGLFESIRDPLRGGVDAPQATVWSFDDFMDFVITVGQQYNSPKVQLLAVCGRAFLQTFQQYTEPFVQYSGVNNTFGGMNVEGLDVQTATLAGVKVGFIIAPALGNADMNPTPTSITGLTGTIMDNFCFVIDTGMFETVDKQRVPSMQKAYAGKKEILYMPQFGVIESDLNESSAVNESGFQNPATDEDSMSIHFLTRCGINVVANRMGAFYVTN